MDIDIGPSISPPIITSQDDVDNAFPEYTTQRHIDETRIDTRDAIWDALQTFDGDVIVDARDGSQTCECGEQTRTVQNFGGIVVGSHITPTDHSCLAVSNPVYLAVIYAYAVQLYRKEHAVASAVLDDDTEQAEKRRDRYQSAIRTFHDTFASASKQHIDTVHICSTGTDVYGLETADPDAGFST